MTTNIDMLIYYKGVARSSRVKVNNRACLTYQIIIMYRSLYCVVTINVLSKYYSVVHNYTHSLFQLIWEPTFGHDVRYTWHHHSSWYCDLHVFEFFRSILSILQISWVWLCLVPLFCTGPMSWIFLDLWEFFWNCLILCFFVAGSEKLFCKYLMFDSVRHCYSCRFWTT